MNARTPALDIEKLGHTGSIITVIRDRAAARSPSVAPRTTISLAVWLQRRRQFDLFFNGRDQTAHLAPGQGGAMV